MLNVVAGERVLVADVEHALFGADGQRADDHALDDGMRRALHCGTVHERARVAFVAVAHDILGEDVVARSRAPLAPGGKARASLAAQTGFLDFGDDFVGGHGQSLLQAFVTAASLVFLDVQRIDDANVLEHHLVLQRVERVVVHMLVGLPVLAQQ